MPTLRSQAHWLVAQKPNSRPKPAKILPTQTHGEALQEIDR